MLLFSPPHITDEVVAEVEAVLRSGWLTTGTKSRELRQLVKEYTHARGALCFNSATAALELMLRWYGVQEGDEVIVPAYTYTATANVVLHCGAKPVMVDVLDDFTIDPNVVAAAITGRTKAIIPVDFAGLPSHYLPLMKLAEEQKNKFQPRTAEQEQLGRMLVLCDSAHSFGAEYAGNMAGSVCDAHVFSFHAVKNLTTGEGGCLCLNLPEPVGNQQVEEELYSLGLHGQTKDALAKFNGGSWRYDVTTAGYKMNLPDVLAAIGVAQLRHYSKDYLPHRRSIFRYYLEQLGQFEWAELPVMEDEQRLSSCHFFPLRIKGITEVQRDRLIDAVAKQEISLKVHFMPLPMLSLYRQLGYRMDNYPKTYDLYSREISLPVHARLTEASVDLVVEALRQAVADL